MRKGNEKQSAAACGGAGKKPGTKPAEPQKKAGKEETARGAGDEPENDAKNAGLNEEPAGAANPGAGPTAGKEAPTKPKADEPEKPEQGDEEAEDGTGETAPGADETGAPDEKEGKEPADGEVEKAGEVEPTEGEKELASLRRALAQAQGELAACRAGVPPEMTGDAVALALAAVETGTAETVTEALAAVLERHPEWKNTPARAGGFVLGSDPALGSPARAAAPGGEQSGKKRWNRFNGLR